MTDETIRYVKMMTENMIVKPMGYLKTAVENVKGKPIEYVKRRNIHDR